MAYSDHIREIAVACRQDPAFIVGITKALEDSGLAQLCGFGPRVLPKEGPPPAFPSPSEVTLIQTSLFDNWPQGRAVKGIPSRYGLAVEVWTKDASQIVIRKGRKPNFDFKAQCALMDGRNLKRQVADIKRKKRKTPINNDYLDELDHLSDSIMDTDMRVAMLNTHIINDQSGYDRGRYYHDHQFVFARMEGATIGTAVLKLGESSDDTITLAPFADKDAGGNGYARNVVAQSRHDILFAMGSWGTNTNE